MNDFEKDSTTPPLADQRVAEPDRPSVSVRTLILSVVGGVVVTALISVGATIKIVGGDDDAPIAAATSTTATYEPAVAGTNSTVTSAPPAIASIGDPVVNGSAQLTVSEITYPATVERYGNDGYESVEPKSSAKFVLVETTLENVGSIGFDTNNTVQAAVMDMDERYFKTVENMYNIRLNFERAVADEHPDELQPGFSTTMYYLFEIPIAADVFAFAFADSDTSDPTYSYVQVTP